MQAKVDAWDSLPGMGGPACSVSGPYDLRYLSRAIFAVTEVQSCGQRLHANMLRTNIPDGFGGGSCLLDSLPWEFCQSCQNSLVFIESQLPPWPPIPHVAQRSSQREEAVLGRVGGGGLPVEVCISPLRTLGCRWDWALFIAEKNWGSVIQRQSEFFPPFRILTYRIRGITKSRKKKTNHSNCHFCLHFGVRVHLRRWFQNSLREHCRGVAVALGQSPASRGFECWWIFHSYRCIIPKQLSPSCF
jgi:hypothetical protein